MTHSDFLRIESNYKNSFYFLSNVAKAYNFSLAMAVTAMGLIK